MTLKNFILVVLCLACFSDSAKAQQIQNRPILTGLLLEVVSLRPLGPTYQRIPWASDKSRGAWYARFGRIPGWQLPSGALPIRAVNIVPSLTGDIVTLKVSLLRGVTFHDAEDLVGTYTVRENEKLVLEELKNFGVEPFEIKVVAAAPTVSETPPIINKTQSVEVISIEPAISTLPIFTLTLHNLAARNISALRILIVKDGKREITSMPQGQDGEALIKAGDYIALREPVATKPEPTAGGFTPSSPPSQQIVIESVVFEDGTYEGETEEAAMFRGFSFGRKIELQRLVPFLEKALAETDTDAVDAAEKFRLQLQSLRYDGDETGFAALVAAFPTVKQERLKSFVDVAVHGVRKDLLDDLQRMQNNTHPRAGDFRSWLSTIKERYAKWLLRLGS
jgi:hypothetical protein